MLTRTNTLFTLNGWLVDTFWNIKYQMMNLGAGNGAETIIGWFLRKATTPTSVYEVLEKGDRRKPAYAQLRRAWDKLDNHSQQEALDWILQKTMLDPLSGLETLPAKELSGQKPEGWVEAISDLNALKAINDTWGHEAGNKVIGEMGKIVKIEVLREGGRAFRIGGDEVSYWFPNQDAAQRAMERIDMRFQAEVFSIGGEKRKGFSISYGIGVNLSSADNALYQDKERRIGLGQRAERDQLPGSISISA